MSGLTWLLRLDVAGGVFLNDGGITSWGGNTYRSSHPVIGSVAQFSEVSEGIGDELAELELEFSPPSNAALTPLQAGAFQRSLVRLWLAEYSVETGAVVGDPELRFIGNMDRVRQQYALRQLSIVLSCVSQTELMFYSDDGNGMSDSTQRGYYPGDTGHAQATGLVIPVTWGVESGGGRRGSGGGSGGGGFSGFGSNVLNQVNAR